MGAFHVSSICLLSVSHLFVYLFCLDIAIEAVLWQEYGYVAQKICAQSRIWFDRGIEKYKVRGRCVFK